MAENRAAGIAHDLHMGQVLAAVDHACAGDVPAARQAVDEARSVALPPLPGSMAPGADGLGVAPTEPTLRLRRRLDRP